MFLNSRVFKKSNLPFKDAMCLLFLYPCDVCSVQNFSNIG